MPLYDYRCTNEQCGFTFDWQAKIADRDQPVGQTCPKCGEGTFERYLPSTTGLSYTLHDYKHVPNGFKDVLTRIKSQHHRSTIEV